MWIWSKCTGTSHALCPDDTSLWACNHQSFPCAFGLNAFKEGGPGTLQSQGACISMIHA
ncbi:uncharacterized protein LACBIDRAFT_314379 [Laccaria bicolor S238N-H82]|uniref:Predicted protein n=1 Tax=Laccaria bicolor (strain S238N-H82 / ATCC MYA-4686) TaxID=486041 RepID=B0DYF1_LACBS|nr:uncharacterized protein LACBIDRAFT_314379 [Laccaria bicolor S238N-H82]EDR00424.1 predicted protein [Laccaria bicolor S238N-H82]|eukprot:XP_001888983.1 predicted protein [Laccaria bicolor S238N-H82]